MHVTERRDKREGERERVREEAMVAVAATVSARPSKFRVIVNGIKWFCRGGGSQVVLMVPGTTVAPGVSSQSAELLGTTGI